MSEAGDGDPAREDWQATFEQAMNAELTPRRAEQRRVAEALRLVIERAVATAAPPEVLAQIAQEIEEVAAALEGYPQGTLYEGFAEPANAPSPRAFFDHSPFMGAAHPMAPPMELSPEDGRIVGRVRFGTAYEGPPGCVHGGFIAAIFDELLGLTQSISGKPGMTARLTVSYRSPTPLHTDLRLEGELVAVEGRKIFTVGRCFRGDVLTAEAEGLFISIDMASYERLHVARDAASRGAR